MNHLIQELMIFLVFHPWFMQVFKVEILQLQGSFDYFFFLLFVNPINTFGRYHVFAQ